MTKIQDAKKIIEEADKIVIGAGAGLSAAAADSILAGSRLNKFTDGRSGNGLNGGKSVMEGCLKAHGRLC